MKIRFEWYKIRRMFNGEYIDLERVPNIGEHICFDGCNRLEVIDVITEVKGWKTFYTVVAK